MSLADRGDSSNKEIDLLIGADFYWKLVNGETQKIKDASLFAIKSILRWLLNGPVLERDDIIANSVNLIQFSHVLKVSREVKNEDLQFLDSLGIKEMKNRYMKMQPMKLN